MKAAISQAKLCTIDVPIGCVIKKSGQIIVATHNRRELDDDVTAHAEILAIKEAQSVLNTSRLKECEMYVTLEPCPMCAWAIAMSGISTVYFGAYNTQYGAMGSVVSLPFHSGLKIYGGIEEEACNKILEEFFERIRHDNKS